MHEQMDPGKEMVISTIGNKKDCMDVIQFLNSIH